MTAALRVGVIGCGEIAQMMHLPLLHELAELEVAAVCDLSASRVEALGERYGVALRTTDAAEVLASPDVDAVVVCTYDHAPLVADAIAAGKHVLVEKPLGFTPAEAHPLAAAAETAGLVALVGYMKLHDPAVVLAAERLRSLTGLRAVTVHDFAGRFDRHGALVTQVGADDLPTAAMAAEADAVNARIVAALGADHAGWAALYALLLMLGSHDLALLRSLFGSPERVAYARATGDDQLLAVLELPGGVPCVLEIGVGTSYEWWDEWISAHGSDEELRLELAHPYVRQQRSVLRLREAFAGGPSERVVRHSPDSAFRRQWLHFAACVQDGVAPIAPLADGVADLELAAAIVAALPPRVAA